MAFPMDFVDFIAKVEVFCALRRPSSGIQHSLGKCKQSDENILQPFTSAFLIIT